MKKLVLGVGILVVAGVVMFGIASRNAPESPEERANTASQFQKVPNFNLQDFDGNTISLSDFEGKPLVINSWAAWCPFCKEELVAFATVQEEFTDQIVIMAIDRAESREVAKKYSDELGVTDDLIFLLDPNDSFYRSIGGFSMPETIFVDKDGNIRIHKRGPMDVNEIRDKIQQIL